MVSLHTFLDTTRFFQYAGQRGIVAFAWDINVCSHPNMSIIDRARQTVWNKPAMEGIAEGVAAAR